MARKKQTKKKKDYPSVNVRVNGRKATATKTKHGFRVEGFGYKGSVNKKGKDININLRKKGFLEELFD